MRTVTTAVVDRRLAIGGGLAAATGLAWPRAQALRRVIIQRGMAGGGTVEFDAGTAQFSLFASSLALAEGEGAEGERIFVGSVVWVDETVGLTLESTRISLYENMNLEDGEGRHIEGTMLVGEDGEQPFVMDVIDFGAPGLGSDTVALVVGAGAAVTGEATPVDGSEFTYAAQGTIVSGDIQDVDFSIDVDTGDVTGAPPV